MDLQINTLDIKHNKKYQKSSYIRSRILLEIWIEQTYVQNTIKKLF
jgi:hypothetical protein